MKTAIVSSKELGTNCWLPARFVEGARCMRLHTCKYPEKKGCKAVKTEIEHLEVARETMYQHTTRLIEALLKHGGQYFRGRRDENAKPKAIRNRQD